MAELLADPVAVAALLEADPIERRAESVERLALPAALPHIVEPGPFARVVDAPGDELAVEPVAAARRGEDRGVAGLDSSRAVQRSKTATASGIRKTVRASLSFGSVAPSTGVPVPADREPPGGEVEVVPVQAASPPRRAPVVTAAFAMYR